MLKIHRIAPRPTSSRPAIDGRYHLRVSFRDRWEQVPRIGVLVAPYLVLFAIAAAPAAYLGIHTQGAFHAPDEVARYIPAELFAQNGRLYFEDTLTRLDLAVAPVPRGFVQYDGRAFSMYDPAQPLLFGLVHYAWGTLAPVVLAMLPGLLMVTLAGLVRLLHPGRWYIGLVFLAVTPLWYWTSRVYMDLALTYLFVALGLTALILAIKRRSLPWFFGGSVALGLAALVRNSEAALLFIIGLAFVVAFVRACSLPYRDSWFVASIFAIGMIVAFIVPTLILNTWMYGSPLTSGYTLFYAQHFPERLAGGEGLFHSLLQAVRLAFFPVPIALDVLVRGLWYQVALLLPAVLLLGVSGIVLGRNTLLRYFGPPGIALLIVALLYMLISRAAPGTWGVEATEPFLTASLVRYWMPLYLILGIGSAYFLARSPGILALPLTVLLLFSSAHQVWVSSPESIRNLQGAINSYSVKYERFLNSHTEPNAVIIAGTTSDKWTAPIRRTIGIWSQTPTHEHMQRLANTAADIHRHGRPVYFLLGRYEPTESPDIINRVLVSYGLSLEPVMSPDFTGELWRVARQVEYQH